MENWITEEGLIPARDDDPPFFKDFRDRHNRRVEHRAVRKNAMANINTALKKFNATLRLVGKSAND